MEERTCDCAVKHKHRQAAEEKDLLNRLNRIEGQIRGIKSMVEDERYCVDILTQVSAVQASIRCCCRAISRAVSWNRFRTAI